MPLVSTDASKQRIEAVRTCQGEPEERQVLLCGPDNVGICTWQDGSTYCSDVSNLTIISREAAKEVVPKKKQKQTGKALKKKAAKKAKAKAAAKAKAPASDSDDGDEGSEEEGEEVEDSGGAPAEEEKGVTEAAEDKPPVAKPCKQACLGHVEHPAMINVSRCVCTCARMHMHEGIWYQ